MFCINRYYINRYCYILVIVILSLLLPIWISILLFLFFFINANDYSSKNTTNIWAISITFSVVVSVVNSLKVPESDLVNYVNSYVASEYFSLPQYIYMGSDALTVFDSSARLKEPLYAVIVWLMNRLFWGNVTLFKFSISFINYSLLSFSIFVFGKNFKIRPWLILVGCFLMCYIPYIFTISLHLIRQFTAGSLLLVIAVLRLNSNVSIKCIILLSICMVLIHSTSVLFLPLIFVPALDKPFKKVKFWYIGTFALLFSYQLLAGGMSSIVGSSSSMSYALSRASSNVIDEADISPLVIGLVGITSIISCYIGHLTKYNQNIGVKRFSNIPLFLMFFILSNLHQPLLATRFAYYYYPFIPFIIIWASKYFGIKKGIIGLFCLLCFVSFLLYIENGIWTYKLPLNTFLTPLFMYLL